MTEAKKLAKLVSLVLSDFEFWGGLNDTERKDVSTAVEEALANTIPESPANPLPPKK